VAESEQIICPQNDVRRSLSKQPKRAGLKKSKHHRKESGTTILAAMELDLRAAALRVISARNFVDVIVVLIAGILFPEPRWGICRSHDCF
jgi:hypothetical protein